MTTTKSPIKVANRYAALADAASEDGVCFERAKRPTTRDCEELSALIDAHRAGLRDEEAATDEASEQVSEVESNEKPKAIVEVVAEIEAEAADPIDQFDDRLAAIETKREEARKKFETASKATTAHGYALISAATNDGLRMENMRMKLAEMPESIRAQACKLAATRLVPPGSEIEKDLRALYDEQKTAPSAKSPKAKEKKVGKQFIAESATAIKSAGGLLCVRGTAITERIGHSFAVMGVLNEDGKLVITLVEQ